MHLYSHFLIIQEVRAEKLCANPCHRKRPNIPRVFTGQMCFSSAQVFLQKSQLWAHVFAEGWIEIENRTNYHYQ